jgi:hypothetical protein
MMTANRGQPVGQAILGDAVGDPAAGVPGRRNIDGTPLMTTENIDAMLAAPAAAASCPPDECE